MRPSDPSLQAAAAQMSGANVSEMTLCWEGLGVISPLDGVIIGHLALESFAFDSRIFLHDVATEGEGMESGSEALLLILDSLCSNLPRQTVSRCQESCFIFLNRREMEGRARPPSHPLTLADRGEQC